MLVPHPRYKGIVEADVCKNLQRKFSHLRIVGDFVDDPENRAKTVEALTIADVVVTADAASTIVYQANAMGKKVLHVNPAISVTSQFFCDKKLIQRVSSERDFQNVLEGCLEIDASNENVFEVLGIPKNGAKLLWDEFTLERALI